MCVECLAAWQGPALCAECHYPRCQEGRCRGEGRHAVECGTLARLAPRPSFLPGQPEPALSLVIIVRLLRLAALEPGLAARVAGLMDHQEALQGELGNMWRCTAVAALVDGIPSSPYTEQDVLHAIGVLQTNTVAVGVPGRSQGLGLFPTFSLLSHSCLANCRYQVLADGAMVLRTQMPVAREEELTIHYMTPMLGTAARRNKIRKNWFFDCSCPRCADPTELGTFLSALLCPTCREQGREGLLLPHQPLDYTSTWTCSSSTCSTTKEAVEVEEMMAGMEEQLEELGEGPEPLQHLLLVWGALLHPHHYLMLQAKRRLLACLHLTSRGQPSRPLLQMQVHLADESLEVFGVLDPGPTMLRGRMLQYR